MRKSIIFDDNTKLEIIEKYKTGKYSLNKLGYEYCVSGYWIARFLDKNNIQRRKNPTRRYTINENYFDILDTEEKRYLFGFLLMDGNMNQKKQTFSIKLQEGDKEILEKLNHALESNKPLHYSIRAGGKRQNQWCFEQSGKHICDRLVELGMCNNKTFIIKFPKEDDIPYKDLKDFIRGLWDANGSFSYYYGVGKKKKTGRCPNILRINCSLVSTKDICENVKSFIFKEAGITSQFKLIKKDQSYSVIRLIIGGNQNIYNFMKWLYSDASIYLNRKYEKCKEIENILITTNRIEGNNFFIN